MSTTLATIEIILRALPTGVTARKMFGEYGLYLDGKMVALVCDDCLFIKPTLRGKEFWGECEEAPPYPGAKPCIIIPESAFSRRERLDEMLRITWAELPMPKKKGKNIK